MSFLRGLREAICSFNLDLGCLSVDVASSSKATSTGFEIVLAFAWPVSGS